MITEVNGERVLPIQMNPEYLISESGTVYSLKPYLKGQGRGTPRPLKLTITHCGYVKAQLWDGAKTKGRFVHRLVLEAFIGVCPADHEASHLDGNRQNNRLDNLMWETRKANQARKREHGTLLLGERTCRAKFTDDAVAEFKKRIARGEDLSILAGEVGATRRVFQVMRDGIAWSHIHIFKAGSEESYDLFQSATALEKAKHSHSTTSDAMVWADNEITSLRTTLSEVEKERDRYKAASKEALFFLSWLPQDLGKGSLNGKRVQVVYQLQDAFEGRG